MNPLGEIVKWIMIAGSVAIVSDAVETIVEIIYKCAPRHTKPLKPTVRFARNYGSYQLTFLKSIRVICSIRVVRRCIFALTVRRNNNDLRKMQAYCYYNV